MYLEKTTNAFHILAIDPYIKILCEGEKVVSEKLVKNNMPNWNIKATFYRKKPDEPIVVEVSIDRFINIGNIDITFRLIIAEYYISTSKKWLSDTAKHKDGYLIICTLQEY